jgi:soluble lytic murein transglycosylase
LKFTNKSGSTLYTLWFCQVIIFSFMAAYGLTWFFNETPVLEKRALVDRQQLFQNYRILNYFLALGTAPAPARIENADMENPLLAAIDELKRARSLFAEKKYAAGAEILAAVSDRFPFITAKRDGLILQGLYASKRYEDFVRYFDAHPSLSMETGLMRLNSLLKSNRPKQAATEFKALFARQRLLPFVQWLSRPALASLLRSLEEKDWFAKFSFLLKNTDPGEFRRELPNCRFRDLNRLFQAEFAYLGRRYTQTRQLLRSPLPEKYQPLAEKILVKVDIRDDPDLDIGERLQKISKNSRLYPGLLFDLGQILSAKGEFARAMPFYERFLAITPQRDDEYWKTVWLMAWIHYRQDEKEKALEYFRLGSESPVPGYRIASRYWQGKLDSGKKPELSSYPFSYYAVKVLEDNENFKDLHREFLSGIDDPPGQHLLQVVADLKILSKYQLWDEMAETIHWAKGDPLLSAGDLNLLKIIESLLYFQQNQFFTAFSKFRNNFHYLESVRLPNFLSGIFFPRPYENLISAYSRKQEVDPGLALALIREESFFRSDARSPANAYGLMQLLQGTARQVARDSGLKVKAKDLYDPEINIRLGLQYLKTLLDQYDGRLYLALAAYNAGTARVDQWLQDFPDASEEEFIEMIPFSETRNYVKNILRNYFFYRYYYEKS